MPFWRIERLDCLGEGSVPLLLLRLHLHFLAGPPLQTSQELKPTQKQDHHRKQQDMKRAVGRNLRRRRQGRRSTNRTKLTEIVVGGQTQRAQSPARQGRELQMIQECGVASSSQATLGSNKPSDNVRSGQCHLSTTTTSDYSSWGQQLNSRLERKSRLCFSLQLLCRNPLHRVYIQAGQRTHQQWLAHTARAAKRPLTVTSRENATRYFSPGWFGSLLPWINRF